MVQYKLMYFNYRAIAEPIRFLFSYGGIEYEDYRYTMEEWTSKIKATAPFGQGPLLVADGKMLFQSIAIQRYLAEKVGLAGGDSWEKTHVDIVAETIWDLRTLLFTWFFDKANKDTNAENVLNEQLPYMMERLDKLVVKNGGYFVNGKLTWPDLQYTALYECLCSMAGKDIEENAPNIKSLRQKVHAIPSIKAWVDRRPETEW